MKSKGFSFIELIVVLVLISLSIALVTPSLSRFSKTVELKAATKKISGLLRYYRSEAINKGQIYQVLFDPNLREIKVQLMELKEEKEGTEGKSKGFQQKYSLPEGVRIKEVKVEPPQYPSDLSTIEFYPNGGSNGGTIQLDIQDHKGFKIKVNFLTGIVEIKNS